MSVVAPVVAEPAGSGGAPAASPPATPPSGFDVALARATPAALPLRAHRSIGLDEMLAVRTMSAAATAPPDAAGAAFPVAPAGPVAPDGDGDGAAVLAAGERYLGVPYRWGGTDPATGLDCSGFVQRVFADLGVDLPRVSVDQARQGQPVASMDEARPGDLVFWHGDGSRPNHIGIYAGDGRMLVAPRTGDVVRYQDISRTPHAIRRVV